MCSRYITCYPVMKRSKEEEEAEEKAVISINYHFDSMALRQTLVFVLGV